MKKKKPSSLRGVIANMLSGKYLELAREREKRRKSPWNIILIPLLFLWWAGFSYGLFLLFWNIHTWFYPEHVDRFNEFWRRGISGRAFISSFLLMIPNMIAAICLSTIFTNLTAWFIRPARETFEREAEGFKGTSFKDTMRTEIQLTIWIVPICLVLSLIGAATLVDLH